MKARVKTATAIAVVTAAALPIGAATAAGHNSHERFILSGKTTGTKSSPTKVVASGPIRGKGTVRVRSSADNRVDHMTLKLHGGTVSLVAVEKSFSVHPNLSQCNANSVGQGTFKITGGTKAFRGASGRGTYKRHSLLVGSRAPDGTCLGQNAPLAATNYKVVMTGDVTLS